MNNDNIEKKYDSFSQAVEDDDYAIIFDNQGRAKGIWLPEGFSENDEMPYSIKMIMSSFFGDDSGKAHRTLH